MKIKVISIIVAIALVISVFAITTSSVSAAGKPNLSVANISDGQKISWSSTGAQKYYLYLAHRNTIFTLVYMTTTPKKPNGACTEKLKEQATRSIEIPCTQAVGKDMSIINQRPILHRDRHIAIRFTQAMSTQTVAR